MWEQIRANQRRSAVLIVGMVGTLLLLGMLVGDTWAGPDGIVLGIGAALIVCGVQLGIYIAGAEALLLHGAFAKELKRDDSPQLFDIVEEMQIASGLPFLPRIHLIDDPAPNAFAVGSKPANSAICVTTGLLHRLNRDELQGVIAHEMSHLKNRDVQFMTLAAVLLGSIVILSEIIVRTMRFGSRSRDRSESRGGGQAQALILVLALVFAILGPLMAQLLSFACSRKREYLADACGAQFTRYPAGLAAALEKISQANVPVSFAGKATAPLFIVNPLAADGESAGLFATHPPTAARIKVLRGMTGASFAAYDAAYRQATGRGIIGTESLRADAPATIRPAAETGPITTRREVRDTAYRAHDYVAVHCACGAETNVPAGHTADGITCFRCGTALPIPAVAEALAGTPATAPATATPLAYTRTRPGWESFRCACGQTIQLSPSFAAPQVRCPGCDRIIQIS